MRTARFLAAMSGITVLGAVMFNIGDLLRSLPVAELGSLVGQLAVGCGLFAINSFFLKNILAFWTARDVLEDYDVPTY